MFAEIVFAEVAFSSLEVGEFSNMVTGSVKNLGLGAHTAQNAPEAFFEAVLWREHGPAVKPT